MSICELLADLHNIDSDQGIRSSANKVYQWAHAHRVYRSCQVWHPSEAPELIKQPTENPVTVPVEKHSESLGHYPTGCELSLEPETSIEYLFFHSQYMGQRVEVGVAPSPLQWITTPQTLFPIPETLIAFFLEVLIPRGMLPPEVATKTAPKNWKMRLPQAMMSFSRIWNN